MVHEEKQRNVNFNNLDQLNSWCTSKAKSKRHYTWKQEIMYASNWNKKPLKVLKRIKKIIINVIIK